MAIEVLTKDDLIVFRKQLLEDFKQLLADLPMNTDVDIHKGYKTSDVRKILGCSTNTLISLRVRRAIRTKKIGGVLYYNRHDVRRLMEEGF